MSTGTKIKLALITLLLALLAGRLLGEEVLEWRSGGHGGSGVTKGGIGNLPCAAICSAAEANSLAFRYRYEVASSEEDCNLALPTEMPCCIAVYSMDGVVTGMEAIEDIAVIPAGQLKVARESNLSFEVRFVDPVGNYIRTRFVFDPGSTGYSILIQ